MAYELQIGLRYLYKGSRGRKSAIGFIASLGLVAVGGALFLLTGGSSGIAVQALTFGMLGAVSFGLLYYLSVFTTVSPNTSRCSSHVVPFR